GAGAAGQAAALPVAGGAAGARVGGERKDTVAVAPVGADPRALRDALRAAGVDEAFIRQFVNSAVWSKHQRNDIEKRRSEWWKQSPLSSSFSIASAATRKAVDAELRELLGDTRLDEVMRTRQLAGVPEEKRAALGRIFSDYGEMMSGIYAEMGNFQMPEDQKRLELLKAERERDLKALLSPAEYEQVMFSELPEVQRAQLLAGQLDLTEAEFREVVRMRREVAERLGANASTQATNDAEKRFDEALAAMIGRERMEEQQLRQSRDYTVLAKARERLGFSEEVFAGVLTRRSQALAEAAEIQAGAMTAVDKRKALKVLAADLKAGVEQQLGAAAAQGYFMQNGMSWLRELNRGYGVRVTSGGWVETVEIK
ncbi:MAG: hypothetical protein H7067_00815, partial [Burkholderiales bacterium]|nr:hypothetical protein [Opitutaceae bacterium]